MIRYMAAVLRWSILSVSFALALAACSGEPDLVPNTPEKDFVQTGMDAMMAEREVTSVTPNTRSTNSWIDNPTGTTTAPLYPTYMRSPSTDCFYCWDSTGKVTRQDKSSAACARPAAGSFAEPMCVIERGEWGGDPYFNLNPFWSFYVLLAILVAAVLGLPVGAFWWSKRRRRGWLDRE